MRCENAIHTFVKACSREAGLKVVRIRLFLQFAYAFYNLHTQCIRYSVTAPLYRSAVQ